MHSKVNSVKHGPNRLYRYLEIHNTVLTQFRDRGFVGRDTLTFTPLPSHIFLEGEIACKGQIVIQVEKAIKRLEGHGENSLVQTQWYAYNVFIRGSHNILRYDNQHSYPGHSDEHHKHDFDWKTGVEIPGSPRWIGIDGWLTLGEVIAEIEMWYWFNISELPEPDGFPELGIRD